MENEGNSPSEPVPMYCCEMKGNVGLLKETSCLISISLLLFSSLYIFYSLIGKNNKSGERDMYTCSSKFMSSRVNR